MINKNILHFHIRLWYAFRMQKTVKKKITTLDALAGMVQRGFESMEGRFEDMDKRFEDMDKRFDEIEARLADIEARLDHLEKTLFDEQHERIIRLEDRLQKMEGDFRALLSGKR